MLVRHGETDWNLEGRYQGQADTPLNATGRQQAEALALHLSSRHIDAIYSSPLRRALATANAIGLAKGLEVRKDPRLVEIDQGEWEGLSAAQIGERYPEQWRLWMSNPVAGGPSGGETIRRVHDRVVPAIDEIAAAHPSGVICIVAHKTAIVVIRCHYAGLDVAEQMRLMPANGGWETLLVDSGRALGRGPDAPCCPATHH